MEMTQMPALILGRAIQNREIGVKEVAKAYLDRIRKTDDIFRAYLEVDEEKTIARAKEVEEGIRTGRYQGTLAGVPVAVKDNICTTGRHTTCGSRMLENFVSPYDAEAVRRMEDAGMVILGKTNMDEFAMGSTTETSYFGSTKNPWNPAHVPGGSSGGSCAAVAAGEAPLALGSDTGGSIRQPSAFCGVTGLKPTYGRVSRYGLIAYASSLDQIGPIGQSTEDCAALLDVIAGYDPKDSTSVNPDSIHAEEGTQKGFLESLSGDLSGMRIGVPKEYLAEGLDVEIQKALADALREMSGRGARIEFFSLGMTEYVIPAYYIIACAEASSNLARFDGVKYGYRTAQAEELHAMYKKSRAEGFGEEVKRRILLGSFVLSSGYYDAYYLKALKTKALIKKAFDRAFASYDVLLAPAAPTAAPLLGESLCDPMKMYLSDIYTVAVNLAGLPAISVPYRFDSRGLPIGLQFIGDCFQEKKILRAAKGLEEVRGAFAAYKKEGF